MKIKIKTLKRDIDIYAPYLYKKYPISKLILNQIEMILNKDFEDELIEPWYMSMKRFIDDIQAEIKRLDEDLFFYGGIVEFKEKMDRHYTILEQKHGNFFMMLYNFVECILEEDDLSKQLKDSYKSIYGSIQIIRKIEIYGIIILKIIQGFLYVWGR